MRILNVNFKLFRYDGFIALCKMKRDNVLDKIEIIEVKKLFISLTDNINFAEKSLLNPSVKENLLNMKHYVKRLSFNQRESWTYLVAKLNEETFKTSN